MKAIVLAGGYATRLWPITRHRPKMLLPIGKSTVIDRIFRDLENDDRIDDVYVSTNERFAPDFESFLENNSFEKPLLSVEDTDAEDEKFDVVGGLAQLVDREEIDDDLVVIAGDNLIGFDIADFLDTFEAREAPTLAAYDVGSPEKATSYGVVELNGRRVIDFQEKPDDPRSTLVSIGCYTLPRKSHSLLDTYLEEGHNPDEPGWFIKWLQDREPTYAYTFEDAWFDIGLPESYLEAVAWHLDGESFVAESATVKNTMIGDNVHVMAGATLVDTEIEHSIVFPETTLENSTVYQSIIDQSAHLTDLNLSGALIGAHTQIVNRHD